MTATVLRSWRLPAMRGAAMILFGSAAVLWPGLTLVALTALFACLALLAGAALVLSAIGNREASPRCRVPLLLGMFALVTGVVAALQPGLTMVVLILLAGANALATGVLALARLLRIRPSVRHTGLLALSGAAWTLFGFLVLLSPLGVGALALAWLAGIYSVITGAMLLASSLYLRRWARAGASRGCGDGSAGAHPRTWK